MSPVPGADLFAPPKVIRLDIRIAPEGTDRLRVEPRQYVEATVREDGHPYDRVGVHLKGSSGSFRGIDDQPSLTLNFSRFRSGQTFHGLRKIHLNNSVEDPSFFNEFAGSELFRAAGVPAPRVTHACLVLNGRRLGLCVLKEGFTEDFLGLHFRQTEGNLYDTGAAHDVDEALDKDQGRGPDDRSDLAALAQAAGEPDPAQRWAAFDHTLDLERFVSFMAMEVITCHRDGYSLARNNFRIYQDLDTGRLVFLPHGMDQLFGRPDATVRPEMSGLVARAVLEIPEGRRRYLERLGFLATNALDVAGLQRQAAAFLARVRPVLRHHETRALERSLATWLNRVAQRRQSLLEQLSRPEPGLLPFENGFARLSRLSDWRAVDVPVGGVADAPPRVDGRTTLHLRAGPMTSTSWRAIVRLTRGDYRFCGEVRTRGVEGLSFGRNHGAGLRVAPVPEAAPYCFLGDHPWTRIERAFSVKTEREIELICELRARAGEAWFDLNSLRIEAMP